MKKLVAVSATSMSMTMAKTEAELIVGLEALIIDSLLERVPGIYYLIQFKKDQVKT